MAEALDARIRLTMEEDGSLRVVMKNAKKKLQELGTAGADGQKKIQNATKNRGRSLWNPVLAPRKFAEIVLSPPTPSPDGGSV